MCVPLSIGGRCAAFASDVSLAVRWCANGFGGFARAVATLAVCVCLVVGGVDAKADPIDPLTDVAAGPEGLLADTLAASLPGLVRLTDDADEHWVFAETMATVEVRPIIRHAGYDNEFGIAVLGVDGPGPFASLFTAPGPTDWEFLDLPWVDLGVLLTPGEAFAFGIRTPHRTMLSEAGSNTDGLDHMVTWFNPDDPGHFVLGFEDTPGGGDRDFNDLVVEVRFVELLPEPAAIAEPAAALLYGLGLAAIVLVPTVRRFRLRFLGN